MTNQSVINRRPRRPQARPGEILAAALDLFAERGFAATRMEDVARRAGLSKAAIYLYFDDKMALLRALVSDMASPNVEAAQAIAGRHDGPVAPLLRQLLTFIAAQIRTTRIPELMKIVIAESRLHPEVGRLYFDNVIARALPLFEALISRGVSQGEFRAVDPSLAAKAMIGPLLLAAVWKTVFEPLGADALDVEAYAAQHVETFLRGLAP
jgi:AcrR family transcriptional regulator